MYEYLITFVDMRLSVTLKHMLFIYPLLFAVPHSTQGRPMNTRKRGLKSVEMPEAW